MVRPMVGIIQGLPAGLEISQEYINSHLARRQLGYGRGARMKIESDSSSNYLRCRAW